MIPGVDTTPLKVFREVVDRGSFTGAAALLHISQPAVSQHVARLERELGLKLLERSSRFVRLTPAGEVFMRHVDSLFAGLDEARRELGALALSATGRIRLIVFPSAAATFVPTAIGAFRQVFPGVSVTMSEADPPLAVPRLLSGDADFVLAYDYPLMPRPEDPRLRVEVLGSESMAVALRMDTQAFPSSASEAGSEVALKALAGRDWIVPGPSQCREALVLACRRAGFTPRVVSETNDYLGMLGQVAAGVGIAVVPGVAQMFPVNPAVRLTPLTGTRLQRNVVALHRKGVDLLPAWAQLQTMLQQAFQAGVQAKSPAGR